MLRKSGGNAKKKVNFLLGGEMGRMGGIGGMGGMGFMGWMGT